MIDVEAYFAWIGGKLPERVPERTMTDDVDRAFEAWDRDPPSMASTPDRFVRRKAFRAGWVVRDALERVVHCSSKSFDGTALCGATTGRIATLAPRSSVTCPACRAIMEE